MTELECNILQISDAVCAVPYNETPLKNLNSHLGRDER